ncbi:MAG: dihydrolipoyllysine-residue acetyltransferase [Gammaproteobacteria bacterium]|nr:dihydrolipoyllysine-residue acetyltransferase [Gammaproteobacteria bacterium]
MSDLSNLPNQQVAVPDIGTDGPVKVIEVNVKIGDTITLEDPLITLESEKASMEIPAPAAGVVQSLSVKVGDSVSTGSIILTLKPLASESNSGASLEPEPVSMPAAELENLPPKSKLQTPELETIVVPDIGTAAAVKVIEINVAIGDTINPEDTLITLESEKASMEIPAPVAGIVKNILIKVGDQVSTGSAILTVLTVLTSVSGEPEIKKTIELIEPKKTNAPAPASVFSTTQNTKNIYASPAIRRFANELGVDLTRIMGSGRKHRIVKQDIEQYVKTELAKTQNSNSKTETKVFPDLPVIDFSKFGEISTNPLTRIQKLSATNLHRNWSMIPHVTQFDEADITDLEDFRLKYKKQAEAKGYKLTPLVFLMKAAAQALKSLPKFNVSLSADGNNFIQKHYFHIGVAVDTPNGLVVPVIKNVDQKGLFQLAQELAELSQKARDGKLTPKEMQGSCFTISSLGGIGGTAFTPIINYPDVAILGVSRSQYKPVYINNNFVPRLMLPLSLSYDHRAIDGADGARFITLFSQLLGDISQLLL